MASKAKHPRRLSQLFFGLFCYGLGISLIVRAELGVAPWDVLSQGISKQTGLSFGTSTILISALVLLLWFPLREKPGIGTLANAVLVGIFADIFLSFIPVSSEAWLSITFLVLGILIIGLATGLYIGSRYGSGPRDGLMTGLHRVTKLPIWLVRTVLELSALLVGWALGGNFGIGTIAFAVSIGFICNFSIPAFRVKLSDDQNLSLAKS